MSLILDFFQPDSSHLHSCFFTVKAFIFSFIMIVISNLFTIGFFEQGKQRQYAPLFYAYAQDISDYPIYVKCYFLLLSHPLGNRHGQLASSMYVGFFVIGNREVDHAIRQIAIIGASIMIEGFFGFHLVVQSLISVDGFDFQQEDGYDHFDNGNCGMCRMWSDFGVCS